MDDALVRLLLVDDDEDDYFLTRELLANIEDQRFALDWVATADAALAALRQQPYDVCLIDYRLGADTGLALILEAHTQGDTTPMILLTGQGDHAIDLQAMQAGAADYLVKGYLTAPLLERAIRYALAHGRTIEALRLARDAAEAATQVKSAFLANMSHELRTPMNGILGFTELALEIAHTPEQRAYLTMVKDSAGALLGLLNDILDFSKIEARKLTLDPLPFPLRGALGTTLKTLALRAHEKGVELVYQVAPDVPDLVVGDPGRLRQILVNLVGNAIKFTDHGEVVVDVTLETPRADATALHVAVRDTGSGIPPDKQQLILEPFAQADGSVTRRYGGTGLGLAIVKQLAELMGGRVWLESAVGHGSTFHVTIRLGGQPATRAVPQPVLPADLHGCPVLVVDDNGTSRRMLSALLTSWHLHPVAVDGGPATLTALAQGGGARFRLLVLDVEMPAMDGLTLAERIRRTPGYAGTPILLLATRDLATITARARALAKTRCLLKPVTPGELWEAIQGMLHGQAAAADPTLPISRPPAPAHRPSLCCLVAEDNAVNQRLIQRLLEKRGHRVTVVSNGQEVLALLAQQAFDLVFMDLQMPVMDGLEATAAIRAQEQATGRHLPILALTAHAMPGDAEHCLAAGMDAYLTKPLKPEELEAAMDRLLPPCPPCAA